MRFKSPVESWSVQLQHFEALERSDLAWPGLADHRRLVEAIAASRYAARLYALRSLNWLRISPTPGWVCRRPRWADRPWVLLRPLLDGRMALTLGGGPTNWPAEMECDSGVACATSEPWLEWLAEQAGP